MTYGLYLYKQIGDIRLEIHRKEWGGDAVEIKAMGVPALDIVGLDNSGSDVRTPIIKSSVNINIKDLGDILYKELFTSDATKFKVIVKDKGVQKWGGYLTPDSYSQTYEYRTTIKLIARDNLGLLDQLDFDWFDNDFVTPKQLITKAQELIHWTMMPIFWYGNQYESADKTKINESYINVELFRGKTWWAALETALRSMGQQMRYVGNNKVFICNVADLYNLGNFGLTGEITHSIGTAAQMEIVPSWRELEVKQEYGVIKENVYRFPKNDDYEYVKNFNSPDPNFPINLPVKFYKIKSEWRNNQSENTVLTILSSEYYELKDEYLFISGLNKEFNPYIYKSKKTSFRSDFTKIRINVQKYLYQATRQEKEKDVYVWEMRPVYIIRSTYEWTLRLRIIIDVNGTEYQLTDKGWQSVSQTQDFFNEFTTSDIPLPDQAGRGEELSITEQQKNDFEISIPNILHQGDFRIAFYPITGPNAAYLARINSVKIEYDKEKPSGKTYKGLVNDNGNVKESIDIEVGEVPIGSGDYLAYAGGLFDGTEYHKALIGWHRSDNKGGVLPLSELIGRGYAHHFTAFKNINNEHTGGEIVTATIPFYSTQDFAKRFTIDGKEFMVNSANYDIVARRANVTLSQVLPYEHADGEYTVNAISAGGGSVIGGGEKQVIGWTGSTGGGGTVNSKRVYELAEAIDMKGLNLLVDKQDNEQAQRLPLEKLPVNKHAKTHYTGGTDELKPYDIEAAKRAGDSQQDFAARDLSARIGRMRDLFASGSVGSADFMAGLLGAGWNINAAGNGEMESLILRTFLSTPELVKNQIRVIGSEAWLTENGVVAAVRENPFLVTGRINAEGQRLGTRWTGDYFVSFHDEKANANGWFRYDDILRGIYNFDDGFRTVFLRVVREVGNGYILRPLNGFAPTAEMVLARQGNFSDPARQGSIYLNSAEAYIRVLGGMNSTAITNENLVAQLGNLRGLRVDGVTLPADGLYAPGLAVDARNVTGLGAMFSVLEGEISSKVSNGDFSSYVTQTAKEFEVVAKEIKLKADKTTVDGLLTVNGQIRADKIDTEDLVVKKVDTRSTRQPIYDRRGFVLDEGIDNMQMYDSKGNIAGRMIISENYNGGVQGLLDIYYWSGNVRLRPDVLEFNTADNKEETKYARDGIKLPNTARMDMPGVLAAGRVSSGGGMVNKWGCKTCRSAKYDGQVGKYKIEVLELAHTNYFINITPVSNGNWTKVHGAIIDKKPPIGKNPGYFVVGMYDSGYENTTLDYDFEFMICGQN